MFESNLRSLNAQLLQSQTVSLCRKSLVNEAYKQRSTQITIDILPCHEDIFANFPLKENIDRHVAPSRVLLIKLLLSNLKF